MILVDSNIFIDFFNPEEEWHEWSKEAVRKYGGDNPLVINPIIYAEIAAGFDSELELNEALPTNLFRRDPLPWNAAYLASKTFMLYKRSGGPKNKIMPDFYIGAHAAVRNMILMTRDNRRYSTYFPELKLICP